MDVPCQNYILGAKATFVPILLKLMVKGEEQEDGDDDDEWDLRMASATCLDRFSVVVKDQCVLPWPEHGK